MSAQLELTIIVTTHNRADLIDETLASLADQSWEQGTWDILIVDNDSTDDTVERVESWLPRLPVSARILQVTQRHNPSYARNSAVADTNSTSVAFLDDDDMVASGWVAAIGTALRDHPFVASRSDYERLNPPALAATNMFQTSQLGKHFGVPIVDSAGSGCRRALWDDVGGSNEAFRNGQDADFALRIARHGGVEPHFCGDAVYHVRLRGEFTTAYRRGLRRGRAEVLLYRAHGDAFDVRPDSVARAGARWMRLVPQMRHLASATGRIMWAENAGRRVGRTQACVVERTWFP